MKVLIVGGVAGGATAAARLRRLDEKAEIILFEKGKYVSYANCGLPYYIGGVIEERDRLFVSSKEKIENWYNLEIRTETLVQSIDRNRKVVKAKNLVSGKEYEENYDKIILSTGSKPFIPPMQGADADGVFSLWTVDDTDAIYEYIEKRRPKKAVLAGGGFIGLEMAENLVERGLQVTLVDLANQVMPPIDADMAKLVENHLEDKGVKLMLGKSIDHIANNGKLAVLSTGEELESDIVLLSIGVRPNNELAKEAGLELSQRGGIMVDEYGRTSDPDIYAVGDVINVKDYVLGVDTMIPLAGPANKQGRAVPANLLGQMPEAYKGTMGTSVAKVFHLTVAAVGASEKALARMGKEYKKDYFVTVIHPSNHAGYYPGSRSMTLKLVFDKNGKVLGAQIVGYEGVDKRIDTIATTIHFGGTVSDLKELELAYAPPYSSAKDPVNFAGYTAENILNGLVDPYKYEEYKAHPDKYDIIDLREKIETDFGMIPGAKNIPLSELRSRLDEFDKTKTYMIYCAAGLRGYLSSRILSQNGIKSVNLMGGYRTYIEMEGTSTDINCGGDAGENCKMEAGKKKVNEESERQYLNVCGLSCPGPIVQLSKKLDSLNEGDLLEVKASDPGFARDVASWCRNTGNSLLEKREEGADYIALVQKGSKSKNVKETAACCPSSVKEKTMIVFDGDLDKAIAAFIIATGSAAMGNKVHMFFTFWGLSVIRKHQKVAVKKDFMSKMFGMMLPRGSRKLKLSKMNFMGMGPKMIRGVMKKHGVTSLEELIQQALDAGVEMTACQMSMDVMGIKKEELLDGIKIGGVASMLDDNDRSNMNLFI